MRFLCHSVAHPSGLGTIRRAGTPIGAYTTVLCQAMLALLRRGQQVAELENVPRITFSAHTITDMAEFLGRLGCLCARAYGIPTGKIPNAGREIRGAIGLCQ
jgi:IclR family pca regulon transcriptional regulator